MWSTKRVSLMRQYNFLNQMSTLQHHVTSTEFKEIDPIENRDKIYEIIDDRYNQSFSGGCVCVFCSPEITAKNTNESESKPYSGTRYKIVSLHVRSHLEPNFYGQICSSLPEPRLSGIVRLSTFQLKKRECR